MRLNLIFALIGNEPGDLKPPAKLVKAHPAGTTSMQQNDATSRWIEHSTLHPDSLQLQAVAGKLGIFHSVPRVGSRLHEPRFPDGSSQLHGLRIPAASQSIQHSVKQCWKCSRATTPRIDSQGVPLLHP